MVKVLISNLADVAEVTIFKITVVRIVVVAGAVIEHLNHPLPTFTILAVEAEPTVPIVPFNTLKFAQALAPKAGDGNTN